MSTIKFKSLISIICSKLVLNVSKTIFKGGSNFPGRVALKLDKNILKTIARDYDVILITGTNGKTTTTSMIYNIIKASGCHAITNNTGANMLPGIVACFVQNFSFKRDESKKYAVIEVDEANVKLITEHIKPKIITVTNLFRDQLDRYGEVYTTLKKIMEGINKVPTAKLVLNGDESLLGNLEVKNSIEYYGFKSFNSKNNKIDINSDSKFCKVCKAPYKYNFVVYNHLGDFYCEECGYKRPELKYYVDDVIDINHDFSKVLINGKEFIIKQPGIYNIYNALCAYSITKALGIDEEVISNSLENVQSSFGRQEVIEIDGKEVKIILVKNPAGFNQAIDTVTLDKRNMSLAFILNDNYADGRDVSWIWDVNFEKLAGINVCNTIIGGIRLYDMAVRLKIAGLDTEKFRTCENYDEILKAISNSESKILYVLATYTAMTSFRKYLHSKGYIKKIW